MMTPPNDPLAALMNSSWGLSSPSLASQSGKLGAVGGFHVGLPAANQARVGLLCFGFGSVGVDFCGAPIGRGGKKMCIKTNCDVLAHKRIKVSIESFGGTSDDLVFIQVPPQGGKESSGVYLTPTVVADAFDGTRLQMYLSEERTVDQWTSFFASMEATPNPTAAEKDIITDRFEQPPPVSAFTPRSNRVG